VQPSQSLIYQGLWAQWAYISTKLSTEILDFLQNTMQIKHLADKSQKPLPMHQLGKLSKKVW
jgi:hypothetical protein